jgi:conjugal transfer pilus assembly protein TraW
MKKFFKKIGLIGLIRRLPFSILLLCSIPFFFILPSFKTEAKDFGIQGQTWEIQEEGFVSMIKRRLENIDIKKDFAQKVKEKILRPKPIEEIKKTVIERNFVVDPTYTLEESIILPCGKVLYPAGYKINPLEHVNLDGKIIMLDGDDEASLNWFKSQGFSENDKLILVKGSPKLVEEALDRDVYFDQLKEFVKKFNITQVPAVLSQEDRLIKVHEVRVD